MNVSATCVASFRSVCSDCGEAINPGDRLVKRGDWVHAECPDVAEPAKREFCDTCWQEKSATGACGCPD